MKKFGLLCLAIVMSLGALGVGYAAWTDTIFIDGTVNTGSVEITIVDTSNTWVWKVPDDAVNYPDEIYVQHTLDSVFTESATSPFITKPTAGSILVAYADADNTSVTGTKQITATIDNAFPLDGVTTPCNSFCVDAILQYTGSIPVIATLTVTSWDGRDAPTLRDRAAVYFYELELVSDEWVPGNEIIGPVQLHKDDYVLAVICLDVPQHSSYMNMTGSFVYTLNAIQWNEYDD